MEEEVEGRPPEAGLAAAFASETEAIARFWPEELARADPLADPIDPHHARELADAVAAAFDDDLAPLATLGGLDDPRGNPGDLIQRLDTLLRALDAMRLVAARRGRIRIVVNPDELVSAFMSLGRQLAIQAAATLAARTAAAEERAASGTASMAVTMHELRRPLTVLSSYSQLLAAGTLGELSEQGTMAAAAMLSATETMLRLVEALGALARLEDPEETPTTRDLSVAEIIAAALRDTVTEAQLKNVEVAVDVEDGLRVRGDRERLTLAVTNLLSNAVKHAPRDTAVDARAWRDDTGNAHIIVRDRGPGFPPETAERLFEKYYRDDDERAHGIPGTGLGLFIVTTVMERHNGRAEARNAEGGGAEFELTLPAAGRPRNQ